MKKYSKPSIQVVNLKCSSILQSSVGNNRSKQFDEEGDVALLISKPIATKA